MNGAITNADAQDRWMLTTPVSYPADGTAMTTLRKSAANIRLGEYIADATAESIARYGLDTPRLVIRLHQAAGTIGTVGTTGSYATTDYPESTITLVIGEQESDLVDLPLQHALAARRHERRLAGDHYALSGADGAGESCVPFA